MRSPLALPRGGVPAGRTTAGDAAICRRIAERHARTFALASRFLPADSRRMAFAVYAFCRMADDAVDAPAPGDLVARAERLARHRDGLYAMLAGRPAGPVFRELARVVGRCAIPRSVLEELLDGVACDLAPARYASWPALARYCAGVASSVGELCVHVFGVQGGTDERARAVRYARTLGLAMQLTNILRDVGEDARHGRCYLPEDELAAHALTRDDVLHDRGLAADERWAPFMALQIGRARSLYAAARPGIALLAPRAQRCALACAEGYAGILGAIERVGYDVLSQRAALTSSERAALLWRVWRTDPAVAPPRAAVRPAPWTATRSAHA